MQTRVTDRAGDATMAPVYNTFMGAESNDITPFPQTQWTLLGRAGEITSDGQRQALGDLLRRYLPALRTHLLLQRRLPPERADDLLQAFVSRKVLEQRLIRKADRGRGTFRSFLLRSLNNFVNDELRHDRAAGRSPDGGPPLDLDEQAGLGDAGADDPSATFDVAWAREVLSEAVAAMRGECQATRREDIWGVFEGRVLLPSMEGAEPAGYEELIRRFGLASPEQASNVLTTAKRMFARALRSAVAKYADAGDVETEIRDLKTILARCAR
jgi:RNA polymerase sigma-70 factor (ECF subfamily)